MLGMAVAQLRMAGLDELAKELALLPSLAVRGAPLKWICTIPRIGGRARDAGADDAYAACLRVEGAMSHLLGDLIQDRLEREAGRAA